MFDVLNQARVLWCVATTRAARVGVNACVNKCQRQEARKPECVARSEEWGVRSRVTEVGDWTVRRSCHLLGAKIATRNFLTYSDTTNRRTDGRARDGGATGASKAVGSSDGRHRGVAPETAGVYKRVDGKETRDDRCWEKQHRSVDLGKSPSHYG